MKKMLKMTAVFLGWTSCVAQGKCLEQQQTDEATQDATLTQKPTDTRTGLALLQNIDDIFYL
ncbi:hypothetical protein [Flavobacterium caeni]|uniref:Uncharacterized protein n=1 Tax=Flavobacterium caeni TaxID=490189 RepID=A0A1G5HRH2_9FLAO|nr:hypothetical protein [Flavobacterium caeni]SCY66482.1 hypothetical protein SAMN02927903_01975 [Flavobacterium caeni]